MLQALRTNPNPNPDPNNAKAVGNDELYLTFSEGAKLIQRDIVYAPSLYLES